MNSSVRKQNHGMDKSFTQTHILVRLRRIESNVAVCYLDGEEAP